MQTPLYNELVVKYYLSKGLVPFTGNRQKIEWAPAPEPLGYFNLKD